MENVSGWYWKWNRYVGESLLQTEDGEIKSRLYRNKNEWLVATYCFDGQIYAIDAKDIDEAEWRATLLIHYKCSEVMNHYDKIRQHLPDIHELGKKVFDKE